MASENQSRDARSAMQLGWLMMENYLEVGDPHYTGILSVIRGGTTYNGSLLRADQAGKHRTICAAALFQCPRDTGGFFPKRNPESARVSDARSGIPAASRKR